MLRRTPPSAAFGNAIRIHFYYIRQETIISYDFQQFVIFVSFFAGCTDSVLYRAAESEKSGSFTFQPSLLCVGRAGLHCFDACIDSDFVYGRNRC